MKITQLAIVRMNALNQNPYEAKTIISVGQIQAEITKVTYTVTVTFSFKVMRDGHANGDSWNEFRDLKALRNKIKIIAVG